jgi:hypothetical protein
MRSTLSEVESVAWQALKVAKSLAVLVEDRQERVSTVERLEALEDSLAGLVP